MSQSFSLHVNIKIDPKDLPQFRAALKECYDSVTAEPECVFFHVFESKQTPGKFRFVEEWNASLEWFQEVQLKKDYYNPYLAITEPMWLEPRSFEIFVRHEDMIYDGEKKA